MYSVTLYALLMLTCCHRFQPDFVKIKTSRRKNKIKLSEVGFEPTPTRVDCDLNAAP